MEKLLWILLPIIAGMFVWSLIQRKKTKEPSTEETVAPSGLSALEPGGILSITGTDYLVEEKNRYSAEGSQWFEAKLTGDERDAWWLNWDHDDADEVTLTAEVPFHELAITPAELEEIADVGEGTIDYNGAEYHLTESGEARYHRRGEATGEQLYYWDFCDDTEQNVLGIVLWTTRAYEAYAGYVIARNQVEILRATGAEDEDAWA